MITSFSSVNSATNTKLCRTALVLLATMLAFSASIEARLVEALSYEELFQRAELVVVGQPISSFYNGENTTLRSSLRVAGINTEFRIRLVFKGDDHVRKIVLRHYKLADPDEPLLNRPAFVSFQPHERKSFLLFLVKETDSRYAPVNGQLDPAGLSIIQLDSVVE